MLEQVEVLMRKYIEDIGDSKSLKLYDMVPKGKRLRAKLILKIAKNSEDAVKLAAIVELIHAASLLHDDVLDDAQTRRGVESINYKFGNFRAIMLGDILYSKGFEMLTYMSSDISKEVSSAVTKLSVGELLDVELATKFNDSEEIYFDMIYKKTASLIEACAVCAALLSNRSVDKFRLYGKNLGLAFQIIDDVLDIISSEEVLGKPAMSDLKEGKTTLPYIYMHKKLSQEDKKRLKSLFLKDLTKEQREWIILKMNETKAIERSIDLAKKLGREALEVIKDENLSELEQIINDMIIRDF